MFCRVADQEALLMAQGKRIEELTANISEGKSKEEDSEVNEKRNQK